MSLFIAESSTVQRFLKNHSGQSCQLNRFPEFSTLTSNKLIGELDISIKRIFFISLSVFRSFRLDFVVYSQEHWINIMAFTNANPHCLDFWKFLLIVQFRLGFCWRFETMKVYMAMLFMCLVCLQSNKVSW